MTVQTSNQATLPRVISSFSFSFVITNTAVMTCVETERRLFSTDEFGKYLTMVISRIFFNTAIKLLAAGANDI